MRVNCKEFNNVLKEVDGLLGLHVFESVGQMLDTDNESKIASDIANNGFTVMFKDGEENNFIHIACFTFKNISVGRYSSVSKNKLYTSDMEISGTHMIADIEHTIKLFKENGLEMDEEPFSSPEGCIINVVNNHFEYVFKSGKDYMQIDVKSKLFRLN